MKGSWNPERDDAIVRERMSGVSARAIARKYGLSASRVSQIVARDVDIKMRWFRANEGRKATTDCLTWVQIVKLLMPNIEAIRAIAEEKNT